jgi:hypothetical protein
MLSVRLEREVEGEDGRRVAVAHLGRGDDHARRVAVRAVDRQVEVALLGLGRQAGARAAALGIHDDDGNLRHRGHAERLGHQREAGARRRGHRLDARPRCTEAGIDRGDFVLALQERAADDRQLRRQFLHDVGRRGDRVAAVEAAARADRARHDGVIAVHNQAVAIAARLGEAEAEAIRLHQAARVVVARIEGVEVALQQFGALAELLGDRLFGNRLIEAEEFGDRADDDDVLAALRPGLIRQFDGGHLVFRAHEPRGRLILGRIVDQSAVRAEGVVMERPRLLVERDEHVHLIANREDGLGVRVELEEHRAAPDFRREGAEGMDPRAVVRRHGGDDVADGHHTIARFAADPQDKICCRRRTHTVACLLVVPCA